MDQKEALKVAAAFEAAPDKYKTWESVAPVLDAVNVLGTPPSSLLIQKANAALANIPHETHNRTIVPYKGGWRLVVSLRDSLVPPDALANEIE